jgi:hypothetical protein
MSGCCLGRGRVPALIAQCPRPGPQQAAGGVVSSISCCASSPAGAPAHRLCLTRVGGAQVRDDLARRGPRGGVPKRWARACQVSELVEQLRGVRRILLVAGIVGGGLRLGLGLDEGGAAEGAGRRAVWRRLRRRLRPRWPPLTGIGICPAISIRGVAEHMRCRCEVLKARSPRFNGAAGKLLQEPRAPSCLPRNAVQHCGPLASGQKGIHK